MEDQVEEDEIRWEVTPLLGKHFNFNQIKNPHNTANTGTRQESKEGTWKSDHPQPWKWMLKCCCRSESLYFYFIEFKQALWTPDIVTGRLFTWCIAMVQYLLMVLIAFTAIDGIDFSLDSDSSSSSTSSSSSEITTYDAEELEELIYAYMQKYLEIAVGFAMLNAAISLNEVIPWSQEVEDIIEKAEEIMEKLQEAAEGAPDAIAEGLLGEDVVEKGDALKTFYEEGMEKLEENVEAAKDELGYEEEDDEEEDADAEDADADAKPVNSTTTDEKKMK